MRNLTLVLLLAVPTLALAAQDTDNLSKVLQKNGCTTTPPTTTTPADAICKGLAYDYCTRASDQAQCKTYFPAPGTPRSGRAFGGAVSGNNLAAVKTKAENVVAGEIKPFEDLAQLCCGDNPDACRSSMPAGSPAALGEAQIASSRVATAAQATAGSDQATDLRAAQGRSSQGFASATDAAAGIAGACKSTKSMCQERYAALAKSVKQRATAATGQDKTDIGQLATEYEGRAKACDDLSSALAEQNVKQMADYKTQADTGKMTTASAGAGGTADAGSSAQGTKAAKDGSSSGSNMMASLLPAMMQMMNQAKDDDKDNNDNNDQASQQASAAADCSNPATAGCYQSASQNWATSPATDAGSPVSTASAGAGGNYNVPDTSSTRQDGLAMGGTQGAPVTVAGIPGGGGGGFGGGMGGGGSGGGGSGGGGMRGASVNTDIMHGEGGGGGGLGAMNAAMSTAAGGSSGGYTYGRGGAGEEGASPAVDWRQFLPGGAKDPTRKLAGASERNEIQSSQVNIWNRISERIRARCAQGLLRDCN